MHPGTRLTELIVAGPLPTDRVLNAGLALAETIAAAHAVGDCFGGLGPGTVAVAPDDSVLVLDAAHTPLSARRQDDVLALGRTLHAMATGAAPAPGRSPIELNPRLPSGLVQLLQRAVHADPARRFATAAELAGALREVRRAPGSLDSLLPTDHVSSSSRVKPPPRPAPGERDDDELGSEDAVDEQERGLPS